MSKRIENNVEKLYREFPESRDLSNAEFIRFYWENIHGFIISDEWWEILDNPEMVRRVGQKLRKKYPASPEVQAKRKIAQKNMALWSQQ